MTTQNPVIKKPRITEKTAGQSDHGVYVFDVTAKATKPEVRKEVERLYKVKVESVNIAKKPGKRKFSRGQWGKSGDVKKAYVTLKAGDSISLV